MTRGWMSVAFACALGAFIGTLASLEIVARFAYGSYLWSIGALLGGAVGYVAIDFRHFCAGSGRAYRQVVAWRPYGLRWRAIGSAYLMFAAVTPTFLICIALLAVAYAMYEHGIRSFTLVGSVVYVPLAIMMLSVIVTLVAGSLVGGIATLRRNRSQMEWDSDLRGFLSDNVKAARDANPVSAAVFLVRYLTRFCMREFARAPQTGNLIRELGAIAFKMICRFIATAFIYVHSQRRTICFVDATIGAAIGFSFGSAIVGTLAGVIFGLVNYEVVSIRILKLEPSTR